MTDSQAVQQAVNELARVMRNELDDCDRALRMDDSARARRELDNALTKLRRIMSLLQSA